MVQKSGEVFEKKKKLHKLDPRVQVERKCAEV